ncbi:MAG: nucleotide exchange factor GrpE [bacterium]|nr:nucleotide exchange factor GrpE [bacterium]
MKKPTIKTENDIMPEQPEIIKHECKEDEYKQAYLRALADYKNLEHRMNNERQRMHDTVKKNVIMELLPVLDNMDQASIFTSDPGLAMVSTSFMQALNNLGVSEISLEGQEFDPERAEAVEAVVGKEDNKIIKVVQKAYQLNGQLLRHGKVVVSKSK